MVEPAQLADVRQDASPLPAHTDDRRGLITKILQHQDLDSLLRLSVVLCDHELQGDGCSLFLYDMERSEIVLKESTVLTRFLGQRLPVNLVKAAESVEEITNLLARNGLRLEDLDRTLPEDRTGSWGPELRKSVFHFGLTRWAYWFKTLLLVDEVQKDIRWRSFLQPTPEVSDIQEDKTFKELGYCELSHSELGSIVIAPVCYRLHSLPRAVLRVVRSKRKPGFGEEELEWMKWFADLLGNCMEAAISLSDLTDLGTKLEVEDFGRTLVDLLHRVLQAKGCSIFLEMGPHPEGGTRRRFQCIATTGLVNEGKLIGKSEAYYEVDTARPETEFLTSWALRYGQLIALADVHNTSQSDFPGLLREPGRGKFSETDANGHKFDPGPILICPLFLHQGREVAGAIRVVRPRGEAFQTHEQLLFLDISRRLSRVLTNLRLRKVSEDLVKLYDDSDALLKRVPLEVSRLLGVEGCSVFLAKPGKRLVLAATFGALEGKEGTLEYPYDNPDRRGWTGWVAYTGTPLCLNSPEDAIALFPSDPPRHAEEEKLPCEIGDRAYRFLSVPILREPGNAPSQVLGVIRAPRRREDPPFLEEVHQSILVSFAARLSLALNLAHRNEQLEAVAELPHLEEALEDPKAVAGHIVEKAVDVLIDKFGFGLGAIFTLDTRTGEIRLRHGRSTPSKGDLERRREICYRMDGDSAHARAIQSREALLIEGWEQESESSLPPPGPKRFVCPILLGSTPLGTVEAASPISGRISPRQRNLIRLLAGFCANALYNEAVFCKLDDLGQGLVNVGREITVDSPLKRKLEVIADAAARVTLADNVIIHEYLGPRPGDGGTPGRFRESACRGPREPALWHSKFKPGAVPYRVVDGKVPVFAEIAEKSEQLFHHKDQSNFIQREGIRSVAALPLMVEDTCVGCIFFNFANRQEFDAQRKQEIQMMAEYAAIAIYQGRLLEETSKLAREKSNLLRYAEHSLNQPLNALLGFFSNLAAGVYNSELGAEALRDRGLFRHSMFFRRVEQQHRLCEYLCYLVKTFLQIDRLETEHRGTDGSDHITRELFKIYPAPKQDLSALCRRAVSVAEAYLLGSITQDIKEEVAGTFDENAIQISLLNVLVNAVKHGGSESGDGRGLIRLTLTSHRGGGEEWAEILVEDSGPGVPAEEQERIFEKNYKGGRNPGGLGIGLFLTRGYVEAHRGEVGVRDSGLGGACFVVRLPLSGPGVSS